MNARALDVTAGGPRMTERLDGTGGTDGTSPGCSGPSSFGQLITEDLHDGLEVDGVRAGVNSFLEG